MTRRRQLTTAAAPITLVLGLAVGLSGCSGGSDPESASEAPTSAAATPTPSPSAADLTDADSTNDAPAPGQVVSYDDYEADPTAYADSTVVLYFHAPWCDSCQATDASLEADGVPAGLTIVEIDYDSRTDLRQDYGVTIQHSFVLVDQDGAKQEIWTDTTSGAEIADRAA